MKRINKGAKPIRAIRYLKPRYKKIGTSFVTILVIIKVVPQNTVVKINRTIARFLFFDEGIEFIIE